jgi:hypothetical protein
MILVSMQRPVIDIVHLQKWNYLEIQGDSCYRTF